VVLDGAGREILRAPVVVFANGHAALERAWHGHLRFKRVRGQVTHIEAAEMAAVSHVVCGDGYVTPVVQGRISVGATYDFNEDAAEILEVSGRENLARIPLLLPGRRRPDGRFAGEGRVGFRLLTADRLPVAGALVEGEYDGAREWERLEEVPRQRGLYGVLGLGSRGVLWSGLVAEYVAAEISGEPSPLERDLAGAMDPARWVLRSQRERR
jgi:tRNA 5-methylaminomethyl-2-thiouridine biosynthesis bifunctional protein